ncbi:Ubiquitin [Parasponia andersonii]|uniref:HECT-type E3 ubiquitin transferase n=1 Tax=Parasponia andersonii TaxID=3476 RepID=A0A2P5A954_PARAD|nr:Ubiquitin [Parasponia andersonii]
MSLVEGPPNISISAAADHHHHQHHRSSSKRKLDDYGGPNFDDDYDREGDDDNDDVFFSDLVSVRMRKDEPNAVHSSGDGRPFPSSAGSSLQQLDSRVSDAQSASYGRSSGRAESSRSPSRLQFFIRMISESKNLVIEADAHDTVKSLHERIQSKTRIPLFEQRLIYRGKQLQWEQSLAECSIQNDAGLQLVGRMRSTEHPHAWQLIDDMISMVCRLCRGELVHSPLKIIRSCLTEYFNMIPKEENDLAASFLQIFMSSSAPAALVMLYASPSKQNKEYGDISVKHFLSLIHPSLTKLLHNQCAPMLLEFCKLLRRFGHEDPLYVACRNALGSLLENIGNSSSGSTSSGNVNELIGLQEISIFVDELTNRLESTLSAGPMASDVSDFTAFLLPLRTAIDEKVGSKGLIPVLLNERDSKHPSYGKEMFLYYIFDNLLRKMDVCLQQIGENSSGKGKSDGDSHTRWSQYLAILKELNSISKLYEGAEQKFWTVMMLRKSSLWSLIVKYAKQTDDHQWILDHKDVLDFESRRHFAMMMFPEVKEDYDELHEMLIDRSQLLAESFEYIARADPESLHRGLFMEFKNEEATGPGVLREWFFLVCQAIFNPENALFVACPNDPRRFYPNPASKVDPMHLDYFAFAGRVIALALMHKVQVGIVFDRVFFLQLAGKSLIFLEDICDADPCLYNSCDQILKMDAEFIDSDALGLTFVREIEELGSRRVVDLCDGGKSIVVNSKNRQEYVNLLIQHQFVHSISEPVARFKQGFADMLCRSDLQTVFFERLELEDLDLMLHGSETDISVEDWKAHTEYNGYKENDSQIIWFWKLSMSLGCLFGIRFSVFASCTCYLLAKFGKVIKTISPSRDGCEGHQSVSPMLGGQNLENRDAMSSWHVFHDSRSLGVTMCPH